ncbi:MAG: molybdate ABC transporter permease subunit [bacterium]|nr:molybdate ABC transporter permease subunit [bacterium]
MSSLDLNALWLTLRLASLTTLILVLLGMPIAWWLARCRGRIKVVFEAVIALPLVLPPTVLGFYLLITLGPNGPLGALSILWTGRPLAFTFGGLLIGSVLYSMPFALQPLRDSFASLDETLLEAASTLGASPLRRFFTVVLPLSRSGLLTASVLSFAHTLGEFGVVLMIGGNIPGKTQVLSIAIYDHVEAMEYGAAHGLSAALLVFSFALLLLVYSLNRRFNVVHP